MKKLSAILIAVLFFIWILPLGVFIKPSREKIACNGRRAICLCSLPAAKQKDSGRGKKIMVIRHGVNNENSPSGGASHNFILDRLAHNSFQKYFRLFDIKQNMYSRLVCKVIEHVPKV